jgi:Terminase large subunit, T4likevirus-type, N-terminal
MTPDELALLTLEQRVEFDRLAFSDEVRVLTPDYRPREWQRVVDENPARFKVVVLHRRAGKTQRAVVRLVNCALACQMDLGMFAYVAPFLKQAKANVWMRLKAMLLPPESVVQAARLLEVNESELSIRFKHNGAMLRLFGADNSDALRGMRLDGVVLDETAQIESAVWTDVIQPMLTDRYGWAEFDGTPNGVNLLSELFYAAPTRTDWWASSWTVYETGALDPAEVERYREDSSPNSFAREYLCDFTAGANDQVISLADVEAAAQREYPRRDFDLAPKVLGVDPARSPTGDRAVIVRRQGLQMFRPIVLRGVNNMDFAARIAAEIEDWKPDGVFIDQGAGAGVIDRLRQLGYNIVEVPFGGRAQLPMTYADRRTEMWFKMGEWLRQGGAVPNERQLKVELAAPTFKHDPTGRKRLESKDDMRKRLADVGSPDIADALAVTFAAPVVAQEQRREMEFADYRYAPLREHNPLDVLDANPASRLDEYNPLDYGG